MVKQSSNKNILDIEQIISHWIESSDDDFKTIANPIYYKLFANIDDYQVGSSSIKKIFISYCHEDRYWLDKLIFNLTPLEYNNIEFWFDDKIQICYEWSAAIQDAIQTSHMAICLISPYFLNSEFIRKREIPAIQGRQREGMIIFPILVEDCLWNIVNWIKDIQIYPKDTKPLNEFSENEQKKKN